MPPKPSPLTLRTTPKGPPTQADKDAMAMPPPPVPRKILESEMLALATCYKNTIVKTGQIHGFYADARRLGIQKHATSPPVSLASALAREVERYDQLCDVMEAQILRAIAVLERDLKAEQQRVKEADEAEKASEMQQDEPVAAVAPPSSPPPSEASEQVLLTPSSASPSSSMGRRMSTISISSLQRPGFPLKIDLPSPSFQQLSPDLTDMSGRPHSPVTLAPKSARPLDFAPDMLSMALNNAEGTSGTDQQHVDMELGTVGDSGGLMEGPMAGSSGEKPIELDLDNMDIDMHGLFGDDDAGQDDGDAMESLFSPTVQTAELSDEAKKDGEAQDFLKSLEAADTSTTQAGFLEAGQAAESNPSPNTLLASFGAGGGTADSSSGDGQFNIESLDMNFFSETAVDGTAHPANLDSFLGIDNGAQPSPPKTENASG
ncbi:hypothetical protein CYLTODRAFT_372820 [Cylindrobasidium torrendii FP15055 ss-10]|uniref:Uncharacterized protein n=1 Tax=Cylindrobasidium torrendii FP15055 ss-10 TaxID=1314674 RepID=A0A0D7BFU9_9AGAR|nr:hypothetical protein CYLTODRAFT_372820 [Cylindrobasidium torrendii FP15055 ss-10]